nr:ROK family protein [Angustibacter aerolatus]
MQVVAGGHRCECGNRGCWEQYASGNALVREAREPGGGRVSGGARAARARRGRPGADQRPAGHRGGQGRRPRGRRACSRTSGAGWASGWPTWRPPSTRACSSSAAGCRTPASLLLNPARESFRRALTGRGFRPEARVVRAQAGNEAGLVGAADLARDHARLFRRRRHPARTARRRREGRAL